ncbi:hypothetical protein BDQ94DRAFT_165168 [Aspergillus welwitschiae]|uniref:Alpha-ketoglutarate-dependent sulfonate dioxygenase n=1 Tax=Aspergillus welwitschiae TaxID=1341132 RepID=A0A3F3QJY8_9EURO|nr:hypothetical protein BDQ94DRAFT_165168 [Aspergillus welwitschiae]RDH39457.1 hypothetical protein BDQ94DRAFT_165168 [Aspergillus welwitschiae]
MTSFILSDVPTSPSPVPTFITPKQCVTHLKLLSAFAELRDVISNNDGLFGLYDQGEHRENVARDNYQDLVREKRWAVYVSRAVKRYTDWWFRCLPSQKPLPTMADIRKDAYAKVVKPKKIVQWHEDVLPPLDVLMVWHSHMLNPRKYLEDCIRYGKMCVWGARFPWELVDRQIDGTTFEYTTTGEARRYFETHINSSWDNLFDPPTTTVPCPNCGIQIVVEWTMGQDLADVKLPFEDFTGLADKGFRATCHNCQYQIDHDRLKLAKWRQDVRSLLEQNRPMPGCFYNLRGVPFPVSQSWKDAAFLYPSQLIRVVANDILEYTNPKTNKCHNIAAVRNYLNKRLQERRVLQQAHDSIISKVRPVRTEKICIRRMISRYWDNFGPFSLDLLGAVIRQGKFIQQMDRTNWFRSPTLQATISRSIKKYSVFFGIMADNPKQMAVPTLDVDLAWHTHQLSPMQYYNCSVGLASSPLRFMDHNDKVDEVDLTIGFEWTCKAYREVTDGEIYSECVCWFCEAVRYPDLYGHFRSSLLWLSDARKAVDELRRQHDHASKSDNGPHISVHSAVRPQKISEVDRIKRETRALQLLEAYRKSLRRAKKHSRSSKALVSAIAAVNSVVLPTSPPTDTVISQDKISTSYDEDEVNPERKDHVQNIKDVFDVIDHVGRAVLLSRVGIVSLAGMHLLVGLLQGAVVVQEDVVVPEDVVEGEEEGAQDAEAVAGDLNTGNCTTIGSATRIPKRSGGFCS